MRISSNNWCGTFAVIFTAVVVETYGVAIRPVSKGKSQESGPNPFLGYSTSDRSNDEQLTQVTPEKDLVDELFKSYLEDIDSDYDKVSSHSDNQAKATHQTDFMSFLKQSERHPEDAKMGITLNKRMDISELLKDCHKGHQFDLWHRALCARLLNI